jgi:two-component system phosphate regulon sensor histidine kinase PhoR
VTGLVVVLAGVLALVLWRWQQDRQRQRQLEQAVHEATLAGARQRDEAARLAAALGGAGDGLIVLDEAHCIRAANQAAQQLAGLPEALHGRRLEDLVAWPRLGEALAECRRSGRTQAFELEAEAGNGRTLAVRVGPLPGHGAVVAIEDESRLRRLESLRRDFVANVSHELKTPLAAIQGYVETMQDDPAMPAATRLRFLERIRRQTERLTTLVADLLTLSHLDEDAGVTGRAEACDLVAAVRETVRDLASLAEKRGIELVTALPERLVPVAADREALRQVAGNLIDNAIKYTPEGGRVTVQLTVREQRARLEVADTGIGLSPADQERVFERFFRVDRARSRELGGTGLGLAIVKNTVRNLGGEVGVRSALGSGSTFWVELPHEPAAAGAFRTEGP